MSLAQKLKQLRLQAGLTQEQLAARIGESSRTIKHWEHGTRTPNAVSLLVLSRCFHVSVDWLLGRTDERWSTPQLTIEPSAENCKDRVNSRIIYHFAGRLLMLSYQPERKN